MTRRTKWLIVSVLAAGLLLATPAPARAGAIESVADCGSRGEILQTRLSDNAGSGPYRVGAGEDFTVATDFVPIRSSHETRLTVTAETSFGEVRLANADIGRVIADVPVTAAYTTRLYLPPRVESVNLRTEVSGPRTGTYQICTGIEVFVVRR